MQKLKFLIVWASKNTQQAVIILDLATVKESELFFQKKIMIRFTTNNMYTTPLYGKEWHWRNVKMETREGAVVFQK